MTLMLEDKKAIVAEVNSTAKAALSVVAADYRGLTSEQMMLLRAKARDAGVQLRVVRNTLAKRAFKDTKYDCLNEALSGPVILAFADQEPGAPARLLRDFAKDNNKLEVKALSLGDVMLGPDKLSFVATIPTYEEALAKLLSVMKAPITKLVQTMAAPQAKLVRTLVAIKDKKQAESA